MAVFLFTFAANMAKRFCIILFVFFAVVAAKAQNDTVLFSAQGGFYEDVFALELSNPKPHNHIRYTTNGNRPTAQSPLYSEALVLNADLYSKSDIYTIVNTIPSTFYLPDSIQHAIVIRAAVFDENDSCVSQVVTNSYFIRSLGSDFHGLPVLSINADSLALFDYDTGIFVPGVNYVPADSTHTGNYKMKGDEWERLINIEFYDPDNTGINQQCGLRTHGGASRWFQQKGMKLYAREEYGQKHFFFRFFKDSPIVKFKRLNLHPFRCSNWLQMGGTDYISQKVAGKLSFDAMAVREVVVFINGEYWGIYTLEESPDERYIKDHYNADLDSVTIIKYWGVPNYGDPAEWLSFYTWIRDADLTQPDDSAYAYSKMDVPGFIDYVLFETFSANLDWPDNNVKISQMTPGRPFRMMFYDGDGCFSRPEYQAIDHALHVGLSSRVLSRFMENKDFRFQFCKRYLELKHTFFSYGFLKSVLDEYWNQVKGEVERQYHRFHFPWSVNRCYADVEKADEFMRLRDQYFMEELSPYLDVKENNLAVVSCHPNPFTDEVQIMLDVEQSGAVELAIYDVMGRKVFAEACHLVEGANVFTIHPKLSAGLYVLKLGGHSQRIVRY